MTTEVQVRDQLLVSEIFGPTVQGEGPSTGRPAIFLRLSGCNLACTWCDTKYTWDWDNYDPQAESTRMTTADVRHKIEDIASTMHEPLIVITGGEPLLQADKLTDLVTELPYEVEIETAGTLPPPDWGSFDHVTFNISPKLRNSGNKPELARKPSVLRKFVDETDCRFKFVVEKGEDFGEIEGLVGQARIPTEDVWVMPQGTTPAQLTRTTHIILPFVWQFGYKLTSRLHVYLWGGERGH